MSAEKYILDTLKKLVSIPSPLGYHEEILPFIQKEIESMGYSPKMFNRGGLSVVFGEGMHVGITAHMDEIGLAVRSIKANGRMSLVSIGGLYAKTINEANCELVTIDGKKYSGTIRNTKPSVHLSERDEYAAALDLSSNMELILDEFVNSKEEVMALGIRPGDYVLIEARTKILDNGFIKSRFIDDKACVAILLAALKYIKENNIKLNKKITAHFSAFEERGTGGAVGLDYDIEELIALDIGLVGDNNDASEKQVSIATMDSRGPYSRALIKKLVNLANENNIDFSMDVNYPHYGSDTASAVASGHDVRIGLFGPGTFASHGYERTHISALINTYNLLLAYLTE